MKIIAILTSVLVFSGCAGMSGLSKTSAQIASESCIEMGFEAHEIAYRECVFVKEAQVAQQRAAAARMLWGYHQNQQYIRALQRPSHIFVH